MGRLIQKIACQGPISISQPPRIGPSAAAMAEAAAQVPMALPRASFGKWALISASEPGTRSAPPIPWKVRAAISIPADPDRPHHREVRPKPAMPIMKIRLQAIGIARRAAQQQEGGERQRIGVADPLHLRQGSLQALAHLRDRDGDDGAIGKDHAGGKDRRPHHIGLRPGFSGRRHLARAELVHAQAFLLMLHARTKRGPKDSLPTCGMLFPIRSKVL